MRGAEFLSTPSVRRATASQVRPPKLLDISIHALREEGDCLIVRQRGPAQDFYPRPPRGGRPVTLGCSHIRVMISIHALREEGDGPIRVGNLSDIEISIHALREEGDLPDGNVTDYLLSISIHALREEGDARSEFRLCITLRFLSTPSARRATVPLMVFQTPHTDFYPRPPRGGRQEPMKASVRHRLFLSTPSARRAT